MAVLEGLVLDPDGSSPLDLNSTGYVLEAFDPGVTRRRANWQTGPDTDGAILDEEPRYENVEMTARVRVWIDDSTNMTAALAALGVLTDKLQEAARRPGGLPVRWTPAQQTTGRTLYVLLAELEDMPVESTGDLVGWFIAKPVVTLKLTRRPFLYGSTTTTATTDSSGSILTLDANVAGDVAAEARLILEDRSTTARRYVEYGVEHDDYNPGSPTGLVIDSDAMSVGATSGSTVVKAGARDANATGNNAIQATATPQPVAMCRTGNQPHIGVYRVKARVQADSVNVRYRLNWKAGEAPPTANAWATPPVANLWCEIDLGLITIPTATRGGQVWQGTIEVLCPTGQQTAWLDELILVPASAGFGQVRTGYQLELGSLSARDDFTGITNGSGVNARTAPIGGAWSGGGDTDDFTGATSSPLGDAVTRTVGSDTLPRVEVIGSNQTDTVVTVRFRMSTLAASGGPWQGVVARYVDINNYLVASAKLSNDFTLDRIVGGTATRMASVPTGQITLAAEGVYQITLIAFASGRAVAQLADEGGRLIAQIEGTSTVLATAGALASGKGGIYDLNQDVGTSSRYYDDFALYIPPAEQVVINSGRRMEVDSDAAWREDTAGSTWGRVPFRGSRMFLPPGTSRVAAKAHANDIETNSDEPTGHTLRAQLAWTSRYIAPR